MDRKRIVTWQDPSHTRREALASDSGLAYLQGIRDGTLGQPPVARLLGYRLLEVENGRAVFGITPGEYLFNPFASVHGGILSTLLDTAMTASVMSTLPPGFSCSTADLNVKFVRPVTGSTPDLRSEGKVVHTGNRLATAEGRLTDTSGKLYAHGSCTCAIFKLPESSASRS